jgi:DNA (cytosine-5)-methyltransferase 1
LHRTATPLHFCIFVQYYCANSVGAMNKQAKKKRTLNITALFAGIAGLELGLRKGGHVTSLFCEKDPEAIAVLRARFPSIGLVDDVKKSDELIDRIDGGSNLLTGGFPCTDISQAGKTRGFSGSQSSLVRDALALLKRRPFPHVLLENVPNWRFLHGGAYLEEVLTTLENMGYRWAYRTIDALAFGLPQRRQRLFLYATTEGDPRDVLFNGQAQATTTRFDLDQAAHGFYWTEGTRGLGWGENCVPTLKGGSGLGIPSSPAILLTDGSVVTLDIRDAERLQGFEPDWTKGPRVNPRNTDGAFNTRKRWMLVGNAINVRVAEWLGRQLAHPTRYVGPSGKPFAKGDRFPTAAYWDGKFRLAYGLESWPVAQPTADLEKFLRFDPRPLSYKATLGFYSRAKQSTLNFPSGFLQAISNHLKRMQSASTAAAAA